MEVGDGRRGGEGKGEAAGQAEDSASRFSWLQFDLSSCCVCVGPPGPTGSENVPCFVFLQVSDFSLTPCLPYHSYHLLLRVGQVLSVAPDRLVSTLAFFLLLLSFSFGLSLDSLSHSLSFFYLSFSLPFVAIIHSSPLSLWVSGPTGVAGPVGLTGSSSSFLIWCPCCSVPLLSHSFSSFHGYGPQAHISDVSESCVSIDRSGIPGPTGPGGGPAGPPGPTGELLVYLLTRYYHRDICGTHSLRHCCSPRPMLSFSVCYLSR